MDIEPKKLVIVSHQRCGSWMLGSAIGSHPNVTWRGELKGAFAKAGETQLPPVETKWECVAVKYTHYHLAPQADLYIHLMRNPFHAAMSELKNDISKVTWKDRHVSHFKKGDEPRPVTDPHNETVTRLAGGIQRYQSVFYHGFPGNSIEIHYEDLVPDDGSSMESVPKEHALRILEAMGLQYVELSTAYVRTKNKTDPDDPSCKL